MQLEKLNSFDYLSDKSRYDDTYRSTTFLTDISTSLGKSRALAVLVQAVTVTFCCKWAVSPKVSFQYRKHRCVVSRTSADRVRSTGVDFAPKRPRCPDTRSYVHRAPRTLRAVQPVVNVVSNSATFCACASVCVVCVCSIRRRFASCVVIKLLRPLLLPPQSAVWVSAVALAVRDGKSGRFRTN